MIILTPHQLPRNIDYCIFHEKYARNLSPNFMQKIVNKFRFSQKQSFPEKEELTLAVKLKEIIQKYSPTSRFIGFKSDFKNVKDCYILLFHSKWKKIRSQLLKKGWSAEKVLVMPLPEGDFWAYWNNTSLFKTKPSGDVDVTATLKDPNFSRYLVERGILITEENPLSFRKKLDSSLEGLARGHQLYPFPAFDFQIINTNKTKIEKVLNSLSDQRSKEIYSTVLFGAPQERFGEYFRASLSSLQYFEYLNIKPDACIINAGVASGFELPFFSVCLNAHGEVHCIDPDGFDHLSNYVRSFYDEYKDIFIEHRYVMCDRSSGIPPQPKLGNFCSYKPIAIDDFVDAHKLSRVDVIKMDVEGMEDLAITKIVQTVKQFRPQLAIAVYHEIEHFWELPLRIIEMCEDYDFYFNIYSLGHFEGIFYAIPKNNC